MKANEAPENIYCESDGLGNIVKVHNIKWPDGEAENIEYTRTDAFIEKAISWLKEQDEMIGVSFQDDFLERFQNYMKGE